jgi:hypothetical protein
MSIINYSLIILINDLSFKITQVSDLDFEVEFIA